MTASALRLAGPRIGRFSGLFAAWAAVVGLAISPGCSDDPPSAAEDAAGAPHDAANDDDGALIDTKLPAVDVPSVLDAKPDCPGAPGCPCKANSDCDTPRCIDTPDGRQCAKKCVDDCPAGFSCVTSVGDGIDYCLPQWGLLCRPCESSAECQAAGVPKTYCVDYDSDGGFCGAFCAASADCPKGYKCEQVKTIDSGLRQQCVREAIGKPLGTCGCSKAATAGKLATTCWLPEKNAKGEIVGRCKGQRFCGDNGLSACTKLTGAQEDCRDTQCDPGAADPKKEGDPCDDGQKCTSGDKCLAGKCAPGKDICPCKDHAECVDNDGDPCTGTFFCDTSGPINACKLNPASVVQCDKGQDTACLANVCDPKTAKCAMTPASETEKCDDGKACTDGDHCDGKGACVPGKDACTCKDNADCANQEDGDVCNGTLFCDKTELPWACTVSAATIVQCDSSGDSVCKQNQCDPKTGDCALKAGKDGTLCDDGDACTVNESCVAGQCKGGTATCPCKVNADCAKQDDGDLCNGVMYCHKASGNCQLNAASKVWCPTQDDTFCLASACDPKSGQCALKPRNSGKICDDGSACTSSDTCKDGACVAGTNTCTCTTDADCANKGGGDLCKGAWYCDKSPTAKGQKAVCQPNPAAKVLCKTVDDTACSHTACVPKTGKCAAKAVNEGGACELDGDPCTVGEQCKGGKCIVGDNVCGCATTADCAKYDDGDPCNGTLFCDKSVPGKASCKVNPGTVFQCQQPADPCLANRCDPAKSKCALVPKTTGAACSDSDPCTAGDGCEAGACKGKAQVCGCATTADCAKFDDGDVCNGSRQCDTKTGKCVLGAPLACKDNSACTVDSCDKLKGCVHAKVQCQDGSKCQVASCDNDKGCVQTAKKCDDGNPCTDDVCEPAAGCLAPAAKDGKACVVDAKPGTCKAGKCALPAATLDDDDRDGVANSTDKCPSVWNPDNDSLGASSCPAVNKADWGAHRALALTEPGKAAGASGARRTNEPIDIPLVNGIHDSSLLAWWRLDGDGDDASGNGRDLSLYSNDTFPASTALLGKALQITPGSTGAASDQPIGGQDAFTAMAWIKPSKTGNTAAQHIVATGAGKDFAATLTWQSTSSVKRLAASACAKNKADIKGDVSWSLDTWHHVAMTRDLAGNVALFADGELLTWKAGSGTTSCGSSVGTRVGASLAKTNRFVGALDEVMLFNRALSAREIGVLASSVVPYGSTYVPGSQADFDDVIAVETLGGKTFSVPHEIVGIAPHSDTQLSGVAAYWPLDGNAFDVATSNVKGKLTGTSWTTDRFGRPFNTPLFNSKSSYVGANTTLTLQRAKGFAVEAWARMDSTPSGNRAILGTAQTTQLGGQLVLRVIADLRVQLAVVGKDGGYTHTSTGKLTVGRWHHVAANYEADTIRFYIDGVLAGTSQDKTYSGDIQPLIPPYLGANRASSPSPTELWHGALDDVLVHNIKRPPAYFASRARGLPRLRLLASTLAKAESDGSFKSRAYSVWSGNSEATRAALIVRSKDKTKTCLELLSICLGYAGFWQLDSLSGGLVEDSSSWRRDGSVVGNVALTEGLDGAAAMFSGSGYLQIPHASHMLLSAVTLEAAIAPDNVVALRPIASKGSASSLYAAHLHVDKANKLVGRIRGDGALEVLGPGTLATKSWHMVGQQTDGKTQWLLRAGQQVANKALGGPLPAPTESLQIGASLKGNSSVEARFYGAIDEVRLSDRVLETDELLRYPRLRTTALHAKDPAACNDGNFCTDDSFASTGACQNVIANEGEACSTDGGKTFTGSCTKGLCGAKCPLFDAQVPHNEAAQGRIRATAGAQGVTWMTYDSGGTAQLVRLEPSGAVLWNRTLNKTFSQQKVGGIAVLGQHVLVAGSGSSGAMLIKATLEAKAVWTMKVPGSHAAAVAGSKGGYVLAGQASASNNTPQLSGIDSDGKARWQRSWGLGATMMQAVASGTDGQPVAAGAISGKAWLVKVEEATGVPIWARDYPGGGTDTATAIVAHPHGGHAVLGSQQVGSVTNIFLMRVDANGEPIWRRVFGSSSSDVPATGNNGLDLLADGGYVLGYRMGPGTIRAVRTRPDGLPVFNKNLVGPVTSAGLGSAFAKGGRLTFAGFSVEGTTRLLRIFRTDNWLHGDCATAGKCEAITTLCDDAKACTFDSCSPSSGCASSPINGCVESAAMDLDHDGLAGAADSCPTLWTPKNQSTVCAKVNAVVLPKARALNLHRPGLTGRYSALRRTNEPIEVPLANGVQDSSVVAYWKLADKAMGAFGDANGATSFSGQACVEQAHAAGHATATGTVMLWFKPQKAHEPGQKAQFLLSKQAVDGKGDGDLGIQLATSGKLLAEIEPNIVLTTEQDRWSADWHHVALTFAAGDVRLYVDGQLVATSGNTAKALSGTTWGLGCYLQGTTKNGFFAGSMDDAVVLNRPLSRAEVAVYARSRKPWGSSLVEGAQLDFDDVRVTEKSDVQTDEHFTQSEVIGIRPHSDTRLEGVVGYYRMDGTAKNLVDGGLLGQSGASNAAQGRFGAASQARQFTSATRMFLPKDEKFAAKTMTWELWIKPGGCFTKQIVLCKEGSGTDTGYIDLHLAQCKPKLTHYGGGKNTHIESPRAMTPGVWHHLALVRDGDKASIYLDGLYAAKGVAQWTQKSTAFLILGGCTKAPTLKDAVVDELLIHNVARPPSYIRDRAIGLPRVRFMASTTGQPAHMGEHLFHDYRLRWGGASVPGGQVSLFNLAKDKTCDTLLSPCLGYGAWWRLDGDHGVNALDHSATGVHLRTVSATLGPDPLGGALFNGSSTALTVPFALDPTAWTVEALFRPTGQATKSFFTLVRHGDASIGKGMELSIANASGNHGTQTGDVILYAVETFSNGVMRIDNAALFRWRQVSASWAKGVGAEVINNGVSVKSNAGWPYSAATTELLTIGGARKATTVIHYFKGAIGDVRLMTRRLTADEALHYPRADAEF